MVDVTLACGPLPTAVNALMLNVYVVKGLRLVISNEVAFPSGNERVSVEPEGPTTSTI